MNFETGLKNNNFQIYNNFDIINPVYLKRKLIRVFLFTNAISIKNVKELRTH